VPFSADAPSAILRRVRAHCLWLLCVLAAGALAGCTSDQAAPGDTSTPTPGTTYSPPHYSTAPASTPPITTGPNVRPGEKPPTFPKSLETNVPSAADTFAVYWMQTLDWGYATTDSTLAKHAFLPVCTDCERFVKGNFDDAQARGEHFRGGRVSFISSTIQRNDHRSGSTAVSDVTVSVTALETLDNKGHVIDRAAAIPSITYRIWVRWTGSRWFVVAWKEAITQ
jgi:hypothetical protein